MDTDSDGDSYRTELTVFNSDANGDANSNAHSDADSTAKSENAYKVSAQVWLYKDQDHPLKYYLKQLEEFKESNFTMQDYANSSTNLIDCIKEH